MTSYRLAHSHRPQALQWVRNVVRARSEAAIASIGFADDAVIRTRELQTPPSRLLRALPMPRDAQRFGRSGSARVATIRKSKVNSERVGVVAVVERIQSPKVSSTDQVSRIRKSWAIAQTPHSRLILLCEPTQVLRCGVAAIVNFSLTEAA